ncbi:MAG: hypothetical protein ABIS27_14880 [Longimicrobiales bacterium]
MNDLREQLQTVLGDTYRLEHELPGGMSRVFVAEEAALARKVVIKVLPPETGSLKRQVIIPVSLRAVHAPIWRRGAEYSSAIQGELMAYTIATAVLLFAATFGAAPRSLAAQSAGVPAPPQTTDAGPRLLLMASGLNTLRPSLLRDEHRLSTSALHPASADQGRGARIAKYAVVGLLGGAAVGFGAAYLYTHQSRVTDHSEDGLVYIVFVPAGALAGAVIGGIAAVIQSN